MVSERTRRRIERLLDQADEAINSGDWSLAQQRAKDVLAFDPESREAAELLEAAERRLDGGATPIAAGPSVPDITARGSAPAAETRGDADVPTSFANGRYQVSKFLGEGGKKRVYQAHDTLLDREVAFALIKTEGFDQTSKERISREAQAMGRLGVHPNIVAVLDLGQEDDGTPYMVTELMGGGDVEGLLETAAVGAGSGPPSPSPQPSPAEGRGGKDEAAKSPLPAGEGVGEGEGPQTAGPSRASARGGSLPLERTIEIGKAVCEGLEFAHARGIVHRDLKPGNVWLTEDGAAKIGDFGLAVMTDRSRLTREGMMVGTVSYMPPEQATGGDITPKADLYSLGAMLYEMVTGRPPFLGDEEIAIIGQHINTPPVAPTWHNAGCPRPLEALIMRLLSKDPSERPESAQDVFNALDAIDLTARGETVEREANSLESLAGGVFVGRQAEMDQLKAALEDVLGGRGRLVTLVGEPGIGKTRTSEELATYAGLRGAQVLWGRCYEGGGAPPYWPWVQAIRSYVRDIDPDELRRQMGSSASVVAEIVTDVKDRLPELQAPPQLDDPDAARFRLFDSITSFLKTASQSQPLVIVLDDLHWSDQSSLTFLEFIARELSQSRVMLLCTYRDMELNRRHPLSVTLGDLARDRLYDRVLLRGLAEADIARFIEIAAGFSAPAELSATVQRHTEGNPLFVTEVIRDLVQSGELTEEKVSGRSTWSVRIPEGVREVIGRRLDRLSDRANEIFTIAAVVGRDFWHEALRELAEDTTEGQLLDVLDEALDAKLIEELPDEVGHYQFTHALMQETLTGELSSARKVRLHARIAETLERLYGDSADEHAAELVPHFVEAELILGGERSAHYSTLAGEQALAMTAPRQALAHFEQALISSGEGGEIDAQNARLFHGLGRAQGLLAIAEPSVQDAIANLNRAFEYYASVDDLENVQSIALENVVGRSGPNGRKLLETAIDRLSTGTAAYGMIQVRLASVALTDGDLEEADTALHRAFSVARELGDPKVEIEAHICQFLIHAAGGTRADLIIGLEELDHALDLLKSNPSPILECITNTRYAIICSALGRLDDALERAEAGYEIASGIGYALGMAGSTIGGFFPNLATGRWQEAEEWVDREESAVVTQDFKIGPAWRLLNRSLQHPVADIEEVRELMRRINFGLAAGTVIALGALGEVCYAFPDLGFQGDLETARDGALESFSRVFKAMRFGPEAAASAGMVAVALRDKDGAQHPYRLLTRSGDLLAMGLSSDRVLGLLAALLDDPAAAAGHFEDALTFCRENGCLKELAWTCSDYAELLLDRTSTGSAEADPSSAPGDDDREKAIELQDEALAITRELGMRPLTERILARREILRA